MERIIMKKYVFFVVWFYLITMVSYAQKINIRDQENYRPLEFVVLTCELPDVSALTNAMGKADISAFEDAEEIKIQLLGYETITKSYDELKEDSFDVFMKTTSISLDQIIVSATRWNQHKKDVPVKIATIIPKETHLQNPQTAADLLGTSGEVFIQKSQQGGGSPMIRGFATNRLLLTVDGIRMNTAIFRSGNLQNVISLDPFAMERTEVLFGPGSVIYGSDAIGGVMSFHTLTPQVSLYDEPFVKGNGVTRHSSANNELTGHVDLNIGWKNVALISSFSYNRYGDLRMGSVGPDEYIREEYVQRVDGIDKVFANEDDLVQKPTGYAQTNMMQKIRWQPNEDWDLIYGFHYSTTTDYDRYDRHIRYKNGLPRSGEWYYGPQTWMMNNLSIIHLSPQSVYDQFTIRMAYQRFTESRHDRDFNDVILHHRNEEVSAYSINLDFNKQFGTAHSFMYGIEAVYNDVTSTGSEENIITDAIVNGASRYPQSSWASYAAYINYNYRLSKKTLLQIGIRYNMFTLDADFDTTFYPFPFTVAELSSGAVTGSVGFVYNPTSTWSLSANLSSGFRSPNVDDVGKVFDSEPGAVVVPNPDLSAEYAYNAEIGIAKVFNDAVKIDVTGFYTYLDDAMVRRDFSLNGLDSILYDGEMSKVQALQNASEAYVWGIQAGVELKLSSGFGFSSRFNYQYGEEKQDDGTTSPLRHAAPLNGTAHITYSAKKLKLDFYVLFSGKVAFEDMPEEEKGKDYMYAKDSNGNPYSPGWYTLNFKVMHQISEILSVSGGIENLTDQRYRPYSSGLVAPGRNFILSVRVGF